MGQLSQRVAAKGSQNSYNNSSSLTTKTSNSRAAAKTNSTTAASEAIQTTVNANQLPKSATTTTTTTTRSTDARVQGKKFNNTRGRGNNNNNNNNANSNNNGNSRNSRGHVAWQLDRKYTMSEVQSHCSLDDCWMVIFDKVYNITEFVYEHPGGDFILLEYAGRDATHPFLSSRHGSSAYKMLDRYWIGILVDEELYYSNNSSYCSVYSSLSWRSKELDEDPEEEEEAAEEEEEEEEEEDEEDCEVDEDSIITDERDNIGRTINCSITLTASSPKGGDLR